MNQKSPEPVIQPVAFAEALGQRYLSYAMSTIMSRSLPDVRDGLKPVHRRVLYAMRGLKLNPDTPPRKSARVVGDVIGRYHPHGDQAVYDALVRLAQEFSVRYRLIDGQGNFGNIDGDSAAAMRYTEARLTDVAQALLEGIDEDAVDFRATYDEDGEEPMVLPAAFPNLLANGAQGIAVGMATSIPPHNVGEVCAAALHLLDRPDADTKDLITHLPGPDFPTGGELVESADAIHEAYETGRGGFRLRSRWEVEKLTGGTYQIIVTEIPYQVQKSRLIEKVAELITSKKVPLLTDIRDESTEDVRIVLEPKSRNVDPTILMEHLFRLSDLESRISLNMNVLDGGTVPRVMSLKEVLQAFLDHRMVVLVRRKRHRLGKIDHRLEILGGLRIVYLNLDEVIRIIREEDDAKAVLMATFDLTELQANAILDTRLRSLRKLEEMEINREFDALTAEKTEIEELLGSNAKQKRSIANEIKDIAKRFGAKANGGERRTLIGDAPAEVDLSVESMIEREPITVFLSQKGWIRAVRGHVTDVADVKYKEGDAAGFALHAETVDKLILFGSDGRAFTLGADKLPRGRGFGEPVRLSIDLPNDADIIALLRYQADEKVILATEAGRGFQVAMSDLLAQTKTGRQVLSVGDSRALLAHIVRGDTVAAVGDNRKLLCFPTEQMPVMQRGKGVAIQKYKSKTSKLSDLTTFNRTDGLSWPMGEGNRTRTETDIAVANRAGQGQLPPRGFPRNNKFNQG